jgi:hypothetical protein
VRDPRVREANNDAGEAGERVAQEVDAWKKLPHSLVERHTNSLGVVDEFAMLSTLRAQFPIHHFVFMQTASHMCHEADCESFFSLCKKITDPNMFPSMLCALSKIAGSSERVSTDEVIDCYYRKFGRHAGEPSDSNSDSD